MTRHAGSRFLRPSIAGGTAVLALAALLSAATGAAAQQSCGATETVGAGDTMFSIAQRCDTTVEALRAANPTVDPDDMAIGSTLQIAAQGEGRPEDPERPNDEPASAETEDAGDVSGTLTDGRIVIVGVLTDEGRECQAMHGQDRQLYALTGSLEGYGAGDPVHVSGTEPEASTCPEGITIEVEEIRRISQS